MWCANNWDCLVNVRIDNVLAVEAYKFLFSTVAYYAHFGPGSGPIFLDNVRCDGKEANLTYCTVSRFTLYCDHHEDVGVVCPGK